MNFDQNAHPELIPLFAGFETQAGRFEVRIQGRFEASHFLYKYFPDGSDEPLHGHSWLVEVTLANVSNGVREDGIAFDYLSARKRLDQLVDRLEHVVINNLPEFKGINPTSENIARWFHSGLKQEALRDGGKIVSIRIHEGPENSAVFEPI
ncbi:MAG: 6-carboxytetrahydropterin synthase [Spirochaetia bacterium]|nr:6-carboxytetrahydropterin synthase [Spirochaetia bacterium]